MTPAEAKKMHELACSVLDGSARVSDVQQLAGFARIAGKVLLELTSVRAVAEAMHEVHSSDDQDHNVNEPTMRAAILTAMRVAGALP